jgi:hypothetical protein
MLSADDRLVRRPRTPDPCIGRRRGSSDDGTCRRTMRKQANVPAAAKAVPVEPSVGSELLSSTPTQKPDLDAFRTGLWTMFLENRNHIRHYESQRSTVAGALIAIAAALIGLVTFDKGITLSDVPAASFLVVLGLFGAVFSAKQWERASRQAAQAQHWRTKIDKLIGGNFLADLEVEADSAHEEEFPLLHRIKIHTFWIALHLMIAAIGAILIYISLLAPIIPNP